jgi:hypothetical protein
MPRRPIALLALFLAGAGGVAAVDAAGGAAQTPPRTFPLFEKDSAGKGVLIDNTPRSRRPAMGDQFAVRTPLFDVRGGKRQGSLAGLCTIMAKPKPPGPKLNCEAVYSLPDGDLIVSGRVDGGADQLAIVGGTQAYAGARGTLDSTMSKAGTQDTVTLLP